ncbi:MAG: hypothetical protein MMC23_005668 [Stictis urceolatum]|nr:hypothetical protein [Stictis urceolata]
MVAVRKWYRAIQDITTRGHHSQLNPTYWADARASWTSLINNTYDLCSTIEVKEEVVKVERTTSDQVILGEHYAKKDETYNTWKLITFWKHSIHTQTLLRALLFGRNLDTSTDSDFDAYEITMTRRNRVVSDEPGITS